MRTKLFFVGILGLSTLLGLGACGSANKDASVFSEHPAAQTAVDAGLTFSFDGNGPTFDFGDASPVIADAATGTPVQDAAAAEVLTNVHIVPDSATIEVAVGSQASRTFKVMGVLGGAPTEVDVTDRFVFYVPDNYLVGGFPLDGSPSFTTRLPSGAADFPQQGGTLTVRASGQNPGGAPIVVTTSLTVHLQATAMTVPDGGVDTATAQAIFADGGTDGGPRVDPSRAPVTFYPNDGAMLPPNLKLLEVHWMPGSPQNTLYQVSFASAAATIVYYVRCGSLGGAMSTGGCGLLLDQSGYGYLAQSNAGQGNVTLTVAGTDDQGAAYGVSKPITIQFAQGSVNGGVYYWTVTTPPRIMRFDFGGTQTVPEIFIEPNDYGTDGTCIGCHALSPDGTKIAASAGGQGDGRIIYVNDIAKATVPPAPARSDPSYLTLDEDTENRIQFASFDPLGDKFVAVYGDTGSTADIDQLVFHDGNTGVIIPGGAKALSFEPDHPDWSPDGSMIAMTHVGVHGTSQREYRGGIDVATFVGNQLSDPTVVVPSMIPGKNRYNPSFVPDSSFLLYSETTCPIGQEVNANCDSDVAGNLDATTWAVAPVANATPVHLDNAASPGLADTQVPLDTFPRSTPFETVQGSGKLFWFTVASQRAPGLRTKSGGTTQQLLWMFAVDPAKVLAGTDGSFPGFFLPFQDMSTSNHIAEWTQKIVAQTPAPPAPSPPPPPPPPPAPPPPTAVIPH